MRHVLDAELIDGGRTWRENPWPNRLERAAGAVFAALRTGRVAPVPLPAGRYGDLTATVSLTGAICGSLALCCCSAAAGNLAVLMLGVPQPTGEQIQISLGELAYRIARTIGHEAAGPAGQCLIGPPVIAGNADDGGDPLAESDLIAFEFQGFPVWIRLSRYDANFRR